MNIKIATKEDKAEWLRLRLALWADVSEMLHNTEIDAMLFNPDRFRTYLAYTSPHECSGFLEASIHEIIDEGCVIKHVGYLEGWYVKPVYRRKGIGTKLIQTAEQWFLEQGLSEVVVDTDLDNAVSQKAYKALGYQEIDRFVLYKKVL